MSITRINTNYDAMFAGNQLKSLEASISRATQRLSTGKRINSASDDPAGVAQLSYATTQLRGNAVAIQNIQQVKVLADFVDGALASAEEYLFGMRDIAVQMANDATLSAAQMTDLSDTYDALNTAVGALITNATMKGVAVLNGGIGAAEVAHVGANSADSVVVGADLNITVALTEVTPATAAAALTSMDAIDVDLAAIGTFRSQAGKVSRVADLQLSDQLTAQVNNAATVSAIGDADMAAEVAGLATAQVLAQAAASVVTQATGLQSNIVMRLLS